MITTQLHAEALADPDNVSMHEPLDVVVARLELAFSDIADCMIEASRLPVGRLRAEELAARQRAHDLLRTALIQRALWGVERPICRQCEVERGLGYCRCEIAANE